MEKQQVKNELLSFDILAKLSDRELKQLERLMYWRTYKKGQVLFMEGDPRERLYFLVKGIVKVEKVNDEATLAYTDYIRPKMMFPYCGLFFDRVYRVTVTAFTDIEIYYIQADCFEEFLKRNNQQLLHVIQTLSQIIFQHELRLQALTAAHASDRIMYSIRYLMDQFGVREGRNIVIDFPMTTTDISKLSGTSRETVSHVISQLKKDDVLSYSSKKMVIHKQDFFENPLHCN